LSLRLCAPMDAAATRAAIINISFFTAHPLP
jgi:hypothetical protein